jgi:hypothetical protein
MKQTPSIDRPGDRRPGIVGAAGRNSRRSRRRRCIIRQPRPNAARLRFAINPTLLYQLEQRLSNGGRAADTGLHLDKNTALTA